MRAPAVIVISFALIALPQEKQSEHQLEHSDIDGIPLVRTLGAPMYNGPLFEISSDLVLGVDEGEPGWQLFSSTPKWLITPDNQIILGDSGKQTIYIVSSDGDLIKTVGPQNSNITGIKDLGRLFWAEEGLEFWVEDTMSQYVTMVSVTGEIIGIHNYPPLEKRFWLDIYPLNDRRFLGVESSLFPGPHTIMERFYYCFLDAELNTTGQFLTLSSHARFRTSSNTAARLPFVRTDKVASSVNDILLSYHPSIGRLTLYTSTGDPILHIERDWERQQITDEEKKQLKDEYRRSLTPERQRTASSMQFPSTSPAFSQATLDNNNLIWVERVVGPYLHDISETYTFDVFNSEGVWLGTQELDFRPNWSYSDWIKGEFLYRAYRAVSGTYRFERYHMLPLVPDFESNNGK